MEFVFNCPQCRQELSADTSMLGGEIPCPACHEMIIIQQNARAPKLTMSEDSHGSSELILKPKRPLDAAAKAAVRFHIKTLRHNDYLKNGKDTFDEAVSTYLTDLGEGNLIGVHPIQYSQVDKATQIALIDYGVVVVYKS